MNVSHKPSVGAVIQARMGSTRLAGKTLATIMDRTLLAHVIQRVQACQRVGLVVVATTQRDEDQAIVQAAQASGAEVFAGQPYDVLDRYYKASKMYNLEHILRVTADDPFKDPAILDQIIELYQADGSLDYASNNLEPSFPVGIDGEVFSFVALERAWMEAKLPAEREHVTPYICNHPEIFELANLTAGRDLTHHRWTIDYPQDLQFARLVYAELYQGQVFGMDEVLDLLERRPELIEINSHLEQIARPKSEPCGCCGQQTVLEEQIGG